MSFRNIVETLLGLLTRLSPTGGGGGGDALRAQGGSSPWSQAILSEIFTSKITGFLA